MKLPFDGLWRGTVTGREAGFSQRAVVSGAKSGNGTYNGIVGSSFVFEDGLVELQWNDNAGSGWQESAVISSIGMTSPLVTVRFVSADDNVPAQRDGDYDDLQVRFEHIGPIFEVVHRPFALDRGTLVMFPDGIFDASQGLQYMGVRVRNTWFFDWQSQFPATGVKIGIAPASRAALAAAGIQIVDAWTSQEQEAVGQVVENGYVRVPDLRRGEETLIYFKIDVSDANPSKPDIGFVAQRDAFDPRFDEPTRVVDKQIFISRSSYDPATKELTAALPEGTLRLRLNKVALDRTAANKAAQDLIRCLRKRKQHTVATPSFRDLQDHLLGAGFWQDARDRDRLCKERGSAILRDLLKTLLAGRDIDICRLQALLKYCCDTKDCQPCGCPPDGGGPGDPGHDDGGYPGGGWGDGTGKDGWCRVKPVFWLPLDFSYTLTPNPAYAGQFGPLAFADPWWKVVLIILAVLLAIASIVYDYVFAAEDPQYIIGKVDQLADVNTNKVDAATANLNGSRSTNLGALDAQSDDVNNGFPIVALDSILQLDRTDNGDNGIQDAVIGNIVWKSGGTSATTRGFVSVTNFATSIDYDADGGHDTISGTIQFTNQVNVAQISGMAQPLSQGGDSGSVWVDMASRRPVALNFAGPTDDSGTTGTGNPIREVVDLLKIRFNT
jgi:hypothetical protein